MSIKYKLSLHVEPLPNTTQTSKSCLNQRILCYLIGTFSIKCYIGLNLQLQIKLELNIFGAVRLVTKVFVKGEELCLFCDLIGWL